MGDERTDVPLTAGFTANGSKAINHNLISMFVVEFIASQREGERGTIYILMDVREEEQQQ